MPKTKKHPAYVPSGQTHLTQDQVAYDEGPSVELHLVHDLARVLQQAEDPKYLSISWTNQEKAMQYFNEHGFIATLDYLCELKKG